MTREDEKFYWIVVEVRSGIPTSVELFRDKSNALLHEQRIRTFLNLENDETGLFKIMSEIHQ